MRSVPNLAGMKFGSWTVLGRDEVKGRAQPYWLCCCDCGTERPVAAHSLLKGLSKTCGCLWRAKHVINDDLTGRRFGRLVVQGKVGVVALRPQWRCACDCGGRSVLGYQQLTRGKTQSCGCLRKEGVKRSRIVRTEKKCRDCNQVKSAKEFNRARSARDGLATYCKTCMRARWLKSNGPEHVREWYRNNRAVATAYVAKRRALKVRATPAWSDQQAIRRFYEEAHRLTVTTGVKHAVDHIVPLNSKLVCGLHVPSNLRVIPAVENLSKHNRWWPEMPT